MLSLALAFLLISSISDRYFSINNFSFDYSEFRFCVCFFNASENPIQSLVACWPVIFIVSHLGFMAMVNENFIQLLINYCHAIRQFRFYISNIVD